MDIKIQAALLGLVAALAGILVTMWQVRKQFKIDAELQRRENRIPVMQQLWAKLQPFSYFGKAQIQRDNLLSKISDDLTHWYYNIGGLYFSETSQNFYVKFQKSIQSIIEENKNPSIKIEEISHNQFHKLQEQASVLKSLTARDCGTRVETDSKYGLEAENEMKKKLRECEECNPKK